MPEKIWFITGSSRGFGRVWAKAALERGDKVVATARNPQTLEELKNTYKDSVLTLALDVTDRKAVFDVMAKAHAHFGRLDVIVNNAGYGLFGAVEEVSEADARAQMETNVFGALWVIQAAIPFLRAQGFGHILSVSSMAGIMAFPIVGVYCASKWALEAINESLAQETRDFGIKVTLIEPAGYATDWAGKSATQSNQMPEYDPIREKRAATNSKRPIGDPEATADAIFNVVDAEDPPLRLFLGVVPFPVARETYARRLAEWEKWADVTNSAQGNLKRQG